MFYGTCCSSQMDGGRGVLAIKGSVKRFSEWEVADDGEEKVMKTFAAFLGAIGLITLTAQATTYPGNGNTGFGGPIGLGSLTLTDDGTTVSGTLNKGPNGFNDVLVIYMDSIS